MAEEKIFETKIKKFMEDYSKKFNKEVWFVKFFGGTLRTTRNTLISTKRGVPDILVCVGGRFLAIELKSNVGKLRPEQEKNIALINASGGLAICLRPKQFNAFALLFTKLLMDNPDIDAIRKQFYDSQINNF